MKSPFKTLGRILCSGMVMFAAALPLAAAEYFAKPTASGTGDGSSWANAATLPNALTAATTAGDTVYVFEGTYTGNFEVAASVALLGNYDAPATRTGVTILDANHSGRPLTLNTGSKADGLTIQNGVTGANGGGVYVPAGATLSNATVSNNQTSALGAGVYVAGGTVDNCSIESNSFTLGAVVQAGGGVFMDGGTLRNSSLLSNTASFGAGVYALNAVIEDVIASSNTADASGGGMMIENTRVTGGQIENNTAYYTGGGLDALNSEISGVRFQANNLLLMAPNPLWNEGGCELYADGCIALGINVLADYNAVYLMNTTMTNSLICGLGMPITAYNIVNDEAAVSLIGNCTIYSSNGGTLMKVFNDAANKGLVVYNSLFVAETGTVSIENVVDARNVGQFAMSHCAGNWATVPSGTGIITVPAATVNSADGRLVAGSPCVNRGTTYTGMPDSDLYGTARPLFGIPDIGCTESNEAGTIAVTLTGASKPYTGAAQGLTATVTDPSGLTLSLLYNGAATLPTNVGLYNVTAGTLSGTNAAWWKAPTGLSATLTITQASVTFDVTNYDLVYTGQPRYPTITPNPSTIPATDYTVTYKQGGISVTPQAVGTYDIEITAATGNITVAPGYHNTMEIIDRYKGELYVSATGADVDPTNNSLDLNGKDWAHTITIQRALAHVSSFAGAYVDTIYVLGGTYSLAQTLPMYEGVNLIGGYNETTGIDTSHPNVLATNFRMTGGADRVVTQASPFTYRTTWSYVNLLDGVSYDLGGGALLKNNGVLYDCTIQDCLGAFGGGVSIDGSGELIECTVFNNTADFFGGGVDAVGGKLIDCQIFENTSYMSAGGISAISGTVISGGSISLNEIDISVTDPNYGTAGGLWATGNCVISNVDIDDNTANHAGGVYMVASTATNLNLKRNTARNSGGGMIVEASNVRNLTLDQNTAFSFGAGMYSTGGVTITNGLIIKNSLSGTSDYGSAVEVRNAAGTETTFINCTIADNTAASSDAVAVNTTTSGLNLYNTAIYNPAIADAKQIGGTVNSAYTAVLGTTVLPGVSNYILTTSGDKFPNFGSDYTPGASSYLVNRGSASYLTGVDSDINGDARIQVTYPDLGAIETANIGQFFATVSNDTYYYNGAVRTPSKIVCDPIFVDTTVAGTTAAVGIHTVTVTPNASFTGSASGTMVILANQVFATDVRADSSFYNYQLSTATLHGTFKDSEGVVVPGTLTWQDGTQVLGTVGTFPYTWIFTPTNPNFGTLSDTVLVKVERAPVTITFSNTRVTYNGLPRAPGVTVEMSLPYTLNYTLNGGAITNPINAGTYVATATVDQPNYYAKVSTTFIIDPATLTAANYVISNTQHVYDGTDKYIDVHTTPMDIALNVTYSPTPTILPGRYVVTIRPYNPNYTGTVTETMTIFKYDITDSIKIADTAPVYNGQPRTAVITVPSHAAYTVEYKQGTDTWGITGPTDAGDYTVTVTIDDPRYQGSVTSDFSVIPLPVIFTVIGDTTRIYHGQPDSFQWSVNTPLLAPDSYIVRYSADPGDPRLDSQTNAGTYQTYLTILDPNFQPNIETVLTDTPLIISKRPVYATVIDSVYQYGDTRPDTYALKLSNIVVGDVLSPLPYATDAYLGNAWIDTGRYAFLYNDPGYTNYVIDPSGDSLVINPRKVNASMMTLTQPASLIYSMSAKPLTAVLDAPYDAHVWPDTEITVRYRYSDNTPADIVNYTDRNIIASVILSGNYVNDGDITSTYKITPKEITINVPTCVKYYNTMVQRYPNDSVIITSGLIAGDSQPGFDINDGGGRKNVGINSVEIGRAAVAGQNYYLTTPVTNATGLQIVALPRTVVFSDTTRVYNALPQDIGVTIAGVTTDSYGISYFTLPTGPTLPGKPVNAGRYRATVTSKDVNYSFTGSDTFIITPYPIATNQFIVTDTTQTYNGANHSVSWSFAVGVPGTPVITPEYSAADRTNVNSYPFTLRASGNHTGTYSGVLRVVAADLSNTIVIANTDTIYNAKSQPVTVTIPNPQPGYVVVKDVIYVWPNGDTSLVAPVDVDTYTVIVDITDRNYGGWKSATYYIRPYAIQPNEFVFLDTEMPYSGSIQGLRVSYASTVPGMPTQDVVYTPANPIDVGSYAVAVAVTDTNHTGSTTTTFRIVKQNIANLIVVTDTIQTYSGGHRPVTVEIVGHPTIVPTIVYRDVNNVAYPGGPTDAGPYTVTITVNDPSYTATVVTPMEVNPLYIPQTMMRFTGTNVPYDGSPKEISVTITSDTLPFTFRDYTVYYAGSTVPPSAIGTYPISVVLKRNYTGSASFNQTIYPPKPNPDSQALVYFTSTFTEVTNPATTYVYPLEIVRSNTYNEPLQIQLSAAGSLASGVTVRISPSIVDFDYLTASQTVYVTVQGSAALSQQLEWEFSILPPEDVRYRIEPASATSRLLINPTGVVPPKADVELVRNDISEFGISTGATVSLNAQIAGLARIKVAVAGVPSENIVLHDPVSGLIIHPESDGTFLVPFGIGLTAMGITIDGYELEPGVKMKTTVSIARASTVGGQGASIGNKSISFTFVNDGPTVVNDYQFALISSYPDSYLYLNPLANDAPYVKGARLYMMRLRNLDGDFASKITLPSGAEAFIYADSVIYDWSTITDKKTLKSGFTDEFIYRVGQSGGNPAVSGYGSGTIAVTVGAGATKGSVIITSIVVPAPKKPKLQGIYMDPYAKNAKKSTKKMAFRLGSQDGFYTATITKNALLYNKKILNAGYKAGNWFTDISGVQVDGIGLTVGQKIPKQKALTPVAGAVLVPPVIAAPLGDTQLVLDSDYVLDNKGKVILIFRGRMFGSKPTGYLEYRQPGVTPVKKLKLAPVKKYKDASGQTITTPYGVMDEFGYSVFYAKMPKAPKKSEGTYNAIINSGVGIGSYPKYPIKSVNADF